MSDFYYGDTVLTSDPDWAGADGTHSCRTAIYVGANGDGTHLVVRTSTSAARRGRPAASTDRRVLPDGRGRGNSLERVCDICASDRGLVSLPGAAVLRRLGSLDRASLDWLDGRLDQLGVD